MGKGPRTITPCDNARELKTECYIHTYVRTYVYMYASICVYAARSFPLVPQCAHIVESFQLSRNCVFYTTVNADIKPLETEEIFQSNYDSHAPSHKMCILKSTRSSLIEFN